MDDNVDNMESGGVQTEESIEEEVENMHQGSVIVSGLPGKSPGAGSKYGPDIVRTSDPVILHHLGDIVIDKTVPEGIQIKSDCKKRDNEQPEAVRRFLQCRAYLMFPTSIEADASLHMF